MKYLPTEGFFYLPGNPKPILSQLSEVRYDYYFSVANKENTKEVNITTKVIFGYEKVFVRSSRHTIQLGEIGLCIKECLLTHLLKMGVSREKINLLLRNFHLNLQKNKLTQENSQLLQ